MFRRTLMGAAAAVALAMPIKAQAADIVDTAVSADRSPHWSQPFRPPVWSTR